MIQAECECGRVVKTGDENAGKKVRCPDCGAVVRLPGGKEKSAVGSSARSSSKSSSSKSAKRSRDEGDEFGGKLVADEYHGGALPEIASAKLDDAIAKAGGGKAKKSKRPERAAPPVKSMLVNVIISGVMLSIGAGALFVMFVLPRLGDMTGPAVAIPDEYVKFSTEHGHLTCEIPGGWETDTGGGTGGVPPFATFKKGNVQIQFRSSRSGSAISTIAQPNGDDGKERADELKAVWQLHEYQKHNAELDMSGYQERGRPELFKCGFGEGCRSEFTASSMFSSIHGYRGTYIGNVNQWNVICKCSPGQWKDFQAVFLKVMESAQGS